MILTNFSIKFSQKLYPCQSIIHINDLGLLLKANEENINNQKSPSSCTLFRIQEIEFPFFYIEFQTKERIKNGNLNQIGSLLRI